MFRCANFYTVAHASWKVLRAAQTAPLRRSYAGCLWREPFEFARASPEGLARQMSYLVKFADGALRLDPPELIADTVAKYVPAASG